MSQAFIKMGGHLVQARNICQEIAVKTNHSGAPGEKAMEGVELPKYLDSCWPLLAPQSYKAPGPTVLHYLGRVSEHRMLHIQGSSWNGTAHY